METTNQLIGDETLKKTGTITITAQSQSALQFILNNRKIFYNHSALSNYSKNFQTKKSQWASVLLSENTFRYWTDFHVGSSKTCAYFGLSAPSDILVLRGNDQNGIVVHKKKIIAFSEGLSIKNSSRSFEKAVHVNFEETASKLKKEEAFQILKTEGTPFMKYLSDDDNIMIKRTSLIGFSNSINFKKSFFRKEFEEFSGNGLIQFENRTNLMEQQKGGGNFSQVLIALLIFKLIFISFILSNIQNFRGEFEQILRDIYNL